MSLIEAQNGVASAHAIISDPVKFAMALATFLQVPGSSSAVALERYGLRVILAGYDPEAVKVRVTTSAEVEAMKR